MGGSIIKINRIRMERKLASIQRIGNILPIEGADAIEIVTVNSWKVVSKKGEFKEGDLCVYFEIDSFLPVREEFEFLRKCHHLPEIFCQNKKRYSSYDSIA